MATMDCTASLEQQLAPKSYLIYALASVQPKRPLGGEYKMGASHTVRRSYDTALRKDRQRALNMHTVASPGLPVKHIESTYRKHISVQSWGL